ncbi:MAG: hypothetical protein WC030_00730 [Candidatus Paceibacterota bacterium]
MQTLGLFILMSGFVIGLGAVTVIDLHGFLGRRSAYWTLATTRTHKVTKPLIWAGMALCVLGGFLFYGPQGFTPAVQFHALSALVLIGNGCFLSFSVSPFLLAREREGREAELLPASWQYKITAAFFISFFFWWSNLTLVAYSLTQG